MQQRGAAAILLDSRTRRALAMFARIRVQPDPWASGGRLRSQRPEGTQARSGPRRAENRARTFEGAAMTFRAKKRGKFYRLEGRYGEQYPARNRRTWTRSTLSRHDERRCSASSCLENRSGARGRSGIGEVERSARGVADGDVCRTRGDSWLRREVRNTRGKISPRCSRPGCSNASRWTNSVTRRANDTNRRRSLLAIFWRRAES